MQSQELKERIEQMSAEYDDMLMRTAMQTSRRGSIGSHDSEAAMSVREASAGPSSAGMPGSAMSDGFRLAVHTAAIVSSTRSISGSPVASAPIRVDDVLLGEFEEFAKLAQTPRSTTYMNTAFMKHVVSEDIEPCLRFGPHPRISSHNVLEAIVSNKLQVEEMTPQVAAEMRRQQLAVEKTNSNRQAMLWERFRGTVAVNPHGCQACGREAQCTYRFSMGQRDVEWIQVDSYCRDRLVAVCEFYGFVRYLRQGIYASRSIMDMYQETIHRRLCMFYARVGAYAYASNIDPSLVESVAMARSAQLAGYSPQQFAQQSPSLHSMSPMSAPYLHQGNHTGSTPNVNRLPPISSPPQFPTDANNNRHRSQSEVVSAMPVPPLEGLDSSVAAVSLDPLPTHTQKNELSTISENESQN
ncbi:hypothetical protein EC988_006633 [Linderina pennispora]|nr:hypothetical protein EC988_006633 [Linderina pennispora]